MIDRGSFLHLAPAWWVAHSRLFDTNSGVFESAGQALLVDPGIYPDEIEKLSDFLTESQLVLQAILLTHSHWDHILGPERLPQASILAQARFKETARAEETSVRREIAAWEAEHQVTRLLPFVIPDPDLVFDDHLVVQVGDEALHLYAAPGHAADLCVAFHPATGTLWAGDMLSDLEIPSIFYKFPDYYNTLASLSKLDIRALVPGHGGATTDLDEIRARLSGDLAYLDELSRRAAEAVRRGLTLPETVEACANIPYRQSNKDNADWHRLNVESAYAEYGGNVSNFKSGWSQFL